MIPFNYAQHVVPYQLMGLMGLCSSVMRQQVGLLSQQRRSQGAIVHSASHEVVGRGEMISC